MGCFFIGIVLTLALSPRPSQQNMSLLMGVKSILQESDDQIDKQCEDQPPEKEYDFIIVGAGTAGCTLAARLSEVQEWSVLLLEAGGPEQFYMDIPVLVAGLQQTPADWKYRTVPSNQHCLGLENNQCRLPRGKVMGGSSILNYMVATRGNRRDYDNWERMGNPGWGFKDVLPYFLKAENITDPALKRDPLHSTKGPLAISEAFRSVLGKAFLEAGDELGHLRGDYDGKTQNVFSYFHYTLNQGRRASTSRAYVIPVLQRKNLHLRLRKFVTKVLVNGTSATGVEYISNGKKYTVRARREVILSGGTINTPQILILSGIGPKDHLDELKIPLVKDLKVGYNLMDHVSLAGIFFFTNVTSPNLNAKCVGNDPKYMINYIKNGSGPWTAPAGLEAVFFYDINNTNSQDGFPDVELVFEGK